MDEKELEKINPALARGLTQRRITRRDAFRYAGAGAGALSLSSILAACGVGGSEGGTSKEEAANIWDTAKKEGELDFANWPAYIDKRHEHGEVVYPTLERFTKKTGIEVNYQQVIEDVEGFFSRIQPDLAAGQDTGWDLMVLTFSPTLARMMELGYLTPLDHSYLPNFNKYCGEFFRGSSYDPDNEFTAPWQAGFTGIGYNIELTGREITSFEDLYDPEFKGKIGMFGDNLDLPNLALLGIGVKPEESTPEDWRAAADKLKEQQPLVRKYYTQDYLGPLTNGDLALTMAWSGDVLNLQAYGSPEMRFVIPEEGGLFWTDNMCIPAKAAHPVDAIKMMDYVYEPRVAADIAEWVLYMSPVPAIRDVIKEDIENKKSYAYDFYGPKALQKVLDSPFSFPTESMFEQVHRYRKLTQEEFEEWNSIFQPIYQG